MPEKPRLERQAMCDRLAMEFQDGWIVNLGVGMPTLCSNYVDPTKDLVYHSENGVIGYGPLAAPGAVDRHLVNAGGQHVTAVPGMAIVHHADSFALIRKGMFLCPAGLHCSGAHHTGWPAPVAQALHVAHHGAGSRQTGGDGPGSV